MTRRRSRQRQRGGSLLRISLAAFVTLCGLLLVLAPADAPSETTPTVEARALEGLRHTQRARAAMTKGNYGEANEHIERAQRTFTDIVGHMTGTRAADQAH